MEQTDRRSRLGRVRGWLAALCVALLAPLVAAGAAQANEFGIRPGSFRVEVSETQAGGHPDITTTFQFEGEEVPPLFPTFPTTWRPFRNVKDMVVDVPPGLIGNPQRMPQCAPVQFPSCPPETQVGTATINTELFPTIGPMPVYNMRPARGKAAQFAFLAALFQIQVTAEIRSDGDYGLRMVIPDTPTTAPVWGATLTFWGVPAAREHDRLRDIFCLDLSPDISNCTQLSTGAPIDPATWRLESQAAVVPFTNAPHLCDAAGTARIQVNTWSEPDEWHGAEAPVAMMEGCDQLQFRPTLDITSTTTQAGAPTGLDVDITVPQVDSPSSPNTPLTGQR